ncbi:TetR/AcrR family transcriptional regulator [Brevibacillus sp. B_LB10_24]|uniref:TetR/AcrR family transcriptional regulator n=1 Tax=Brevibacillus sp. B_LB10_24 TaxID=3380645 RepID=UPI0038BB4C85
MPKIVDHEKQREKLAQAAWRVIRRDGMERASVRNIAAEAGLSVGSMRHYFSTQSELLAFSMKLVSDKVKERVRNISLTGRLVEDILSLLYELLPLDEERSAEMEVWVAFTAKALADPALQSLSREVSEDMRRGILKLIQSLIRHEPACSGLNPELEAERLYALIDGLAIHGVMQPERLTPEWIRSVVIHHVQSLCR